MNLLLTLCWLAKNLKENIRFLDVKVLKGRVGLVESIFVQPILYLMVGKLKVKKKWNKDNIIGKSCIIELMR